MHVAHLLRKYNPAEWGGTETAIHRLCTGLRQHAVNSLVYCPAINNGAHDDPLAAAGCDVRRFRACVPVWGISPQDRQQHIAVGGNLMSFELPRALWREPDLDVIHTHTLGRIGGIALTVARWRRLPCVVSIHGGVLDLPDVMKNQPPAGHGWEWGKLFGALLRSRHLLAEADAIVTCNEKEAALLRKQFSAQRVVVQQHGVPADLYRQDRRDAARVAFPQICGQQVLLVVGRIDAVKNQGWVVEQLPAIMQRHPLALLVLAGACTDEAYGETLRRRIDELGMSHRVLLTGGLPATDPRLIGLFQEAQALILPSVSETFGLVVLEAWAAGTATISSRTSGASALIRHGEDGWLFDLDDPRAFHEAVDQALLKPQFAAQLAAAGGQRVRAEFGIGALAGRLKNLYASLIEAKSCAT